MSKPRFALAEIVDQPNGEDYCVDKGLGEGRAYGQIIRRTGLTVSDSTRPWAKGVNGAVAL